MSDHPVIPLAKKNKNPLLLQATNWTNVDDLETELILKIDNLQPML